MMNGLGYAGILQPGRALAHLQLRRRINGAASKGGGRVVKALTSLLNYIKQYEGLDLSPAALDRLWIVTELAGASHDPIARDVLVNLVNQIAFLGSRLGFIVPAQERPAQNELLNSALRAIANIGLTEQAFHALEYALGMPESFATVVQVLKDSDRDLQRSFVYSRTPIHCIALMQELGFLPGNAWDAVVWSGSLGVKFACKHPLSVGDIYHWLDKISFHANMSDRDRTRVFDCLAILLAHPDREVAETCIHHLVQKAIRVEASCWPDYKLIARMLRPGKRYKGLSRVCRIVLGELKEQITSDISAQLAEWFDARYSGRLIETGLIFGPLASSSHCVLWAIQSMMEICPDQAEEILVGCADGAPIHPVHLEYVRGKLSK
jgi:hypothetical protein